MGEQGWRGSALEQRRNDRQRRAEANRVKNAKSIGDWSRIGRTLGVEDDWWGESLNDGSEEPSNVFDDADYEPGDELPDELVSDEFFVSTVRTNLCHTI